MEPFRYNEPENYFLGKVKEIAKKNNAVLIFDEVSSGWRHIIGGVHKQYNVEPDIAIFGKALGNGFPISAVIGTGEAMSAAEECFTSSTYWTECMGPVAAIATIEKFKKLNLPELLSSAGRRVQNIWRSASTRYNIDLKIEGRPSLTHFSFEKEKKMELNTLFSQEMLKRGFLANTNYYASYVHSDSILNEYENAFDKVFDIICVALRKNKVKENLKGPVAITHFGRVT